MLTLSGISGSPCRYKLQLPTRSPGSCAQRVSLISDDSRSLKLLQRERRDWAGSSQRYTLPRLPSIKCAFDASYGDSRNSPPDVFPRMNVKDPYKRLGISPEASEDEIQSARNFLVQRYGDHKPSVDAIESAHDKIIMQKFYERRRPKFNIKKRVRDVTQSRYVQAITSRFRTPSTKVMIKTAFAFLVLGGLTVLFPTEEGPTLQVAVSLILTIYFIYDRLKSTLWALLYGIGAFILSWLLGTLLMVSVIPPILKGPTSLEVTTSLISYLFLWTASTYLR